MLISPGQLTRAILQFIHAGGVALTLPASTKDAICASAEIVQRGRWRFARLWRQHRLWQAREPTHCQHRTHPGDRVAGCGAGNRTSPPGTNINCIRTRACVAAETCSRVDAGPSPVTGYRIRDSIGARWLDFARFTRVAGLAAALVVAAKLGRPSIRIAKILKVNRRVSQNS